MQMEISHDLEIKKWSRSKEFNLSTYSKYYYLVMSDSYSLSLGQIKLFT